MHIHRHTLAHIWHIRLLMFIVYLFYAIRHWFYNSASVQRQLSMRTSSCVSCSFFSSSFSRSCYTYSLLLILLFIQAVTDFWYFTCIKFRIHLPLLRLFIHVCDSEFVSFFLWICIYSVFMSQIHTHTRCLFILDLSYMLFSILFCFTLFYVCVCVFVSVMFEFLFAHGVGAYVQFNALICIKMKHSNAYFRNKL